MVETRSSTQQYAVKLHTFPEFTCYHVKPCSYCIIVKLTSLPISEGEMRAPIDLVAVIDRSGSMAGEKLRLVKKVLHFFVSHLRSIDRLGIVIYDDSMQEIAVLTEVTSVNCIELDDKIEEISDGGSTNLSGGLLKGMSVMKHRSGTHADVASVLLFTDGIANAGITNTDDIIIAMHDAYGGVENFTVNTFGFGSDHNVEMLKEISQTGNGLYYFIESTDRIPETFISCLGGLTSTSAQNISITIDTCSGTVVKEMHSKAKPILTNENKRGQVSILDLQSQEEHHVLIELTLPEIKGYYLNISSSNTYAEITLNSFNVIKQNHETVRTKVRVPRRSDPGRQTPCSVVDEQRNRIQMVQALAEAAQMAGEGKLYEARNAIKQNQQFISASSSRDSSKNRSLVADLSRAMSALSDESCYANYGRSTFATLIDSHSTQRSTGMRSSSYITPPRLKTYSQYVNLSKTDYPPSNPPSSKPAVVKRCVAPATPVTREPVEKPIPMKRRRLVGLRVRGSRNICKMVILVIFLICFLVGLYLCL